MSISLFRIAAALCFLAVALGAFGAHALRSTLEGRGMVDVWNKAVFYQFVHAIALLVLALYGTINRGACLLLLMGILLFSGSLYLLALTNPRWLGPVTPLGGLVFPCRVGVAGSRTAEVDRRQLRATVFYLALTNPGAGASSPFKRNAEKLFRRSGSGILLPRCSTR